MYGYGFPPPYGYPMPFPEPRRKKDGNFKKKDVLRLAREVLRQNHMDKKKKVDDEKKKADRDKPRVFTLLETAGLIMLCSVPFTLLQIYVLQSVQQAMQNFLNGSVN